MEAFLISTGLVSLSEAGDKTQLLTLLLAARFRKLWSVAAAILLATVASHALAAAAGTWVAQSVDDDVLRWALGGSFCAMALWMLVPDPFGENELAGHRLQLGAFGTALIACTVAEMGDKTQVTTVMLAAQYDDWIDVVAGATLGTVLSNLPGVWFGERVVRLARAPLVRGGSALLFLAFGVVAFIGWA